jgi:hypothetical protein
MSSLNFPFWHTLAAETQNAYLIAESMKETGLSIGRTAFNMSKGTWTGARLSAGLTRFSTVMAEWGVTSAEAEAVIAHGARVAAATTTAAETGALMGALIAVGRWLGIKGAIAAGVAGAVVATVVLGGVTYVVANAAGELSADSPVLQGERITRRTDVEAGVEPSSSSSNVPAPLDADVPQLDEEAQQRYDEELRKQLGVMSETESDSGGEEADPDVRPPSRVYRELEDDDRDDDRHKKERHHDDDDPRKKKHDRDDDRRKKGDDHDDDHRKSRSSRDHGDDDNDDDDSRSSCSDDE